MPHSNSAKKRVRQNEHHRLRNRAFVAALRTQKKHLLAVIAAGDATSAATKYQALSRTLDKVAHKGVIHPNLAARTKARLFKMVHAIQPAG